MAIKLKTKRPAVTEELVESNRLRLENQLIESQLSWLERYVDPRSAFYDETTGEYWGSSKSTLGRLSENEEPYTNESEVAEMRRRSRVLARRNPYIINMLRTLASFVIGKGHRYSVNVKPGKDLKLATPIKRQLERFIKRLLKLNNWGRRQRESYRRYHRDGEVFIRIFPQEDGYARFRFVEPSRILTPPEFAEDPSATFGIKTDPDDVETIEYYFVDGEAVGEHEIQHRKANVDVTTKRGLSSVYAVESHSQRGLQLLTNMSTMIQTRAAIAMIRKHDRPPSAVRSFATKNAAWEQRSNITGETLKQKPIRPGSVIDATKNTDYEFPTLNANAADGTEVLAAELRAVAASQSMPEYMIGSDASNANYASTMVAESPAVRHFECEQTDWIEADLELLEAAIDYAIQAGRLPDTVHDFLELAVEPPTLVVRDRYKEAQTSQIYLDKKVMSPQTAAATAGLDPSQEAKNWQEFDDQHGDATLPTDDAFIQADGGNTNVNLNNADAVAAAASPEAALLNMAGGISGYLEIMKALSDGSIGREQAIAAIQKFFKLERAEAEHLVGGGT